MARQPRAAKGAATLDRESVSPIKPNPKPPTSSRSRKKTPADEGKTPQATKKTTTASAQPKKATSRSKRAVAVAAEEQADGPIQRSKRQGRQTKVEEDVAPAKIKYRSRTPLRAESEESDGSTGPTYSGKSHLLYSVDKKGQLVASPRVNKQLQTHQAPTTTTTTTTPVPNTSKSHTFMAIFSIAFYFIASISTVFLNKYLLDAPELAKSKVFITWVQIVFSALINYPISLFTAPQSTDKDEKAESYSIWPLFHTLPAAFIFCFMLLLNNLCLAYVHVTFYQVARSWTIIMSLLLSYFFYGDNPSRGQLICCLVVIAGYILACDGTVAWGELFTELKSLSLATLTTAGSGTKIILGIVSGFFSCFMVAYHSIISKQLQQTTTISRSTLISALNINASILLFIYIFITGEFQATISNPALYDSKTALPLLIVSFSGYLLGYATQMQIQYTSPLGHNVSGTAKATVQSALGWFLQPLKITPLAVFGTAVTIIGCGVYSVVGGPAKTQQGPPPPPAPPKKADVNAPPRWAQAVFPLKSQ